MNGIFGIFLRDGARVQQSSLAAMRSAMAYWGRDGGDVWLEGCAGLGQLRTFATVESVHERLPAFDAASGCAFTAQGRLDNREELIRQTGFDGDNSQLSDAELMRRAYLCWGEEAPNRIFGDWSLAAWHPSERRLFLARDHLGSAGIYYHCSPHLFAFASDRRALLALDLKQTQLDELFLAKLLLPWRDFHDERTVHSTIRRLPPAHCLTVTSDSQASRLYWRLEDVPEIRFARREDYVEAFRELFTDAVRQRLREPSDWGRVACMLSGGLDSGSVTATAAGLVRPVGRRIAAFTSAPAHDTTSFFRDGLGDELPDARATAEFAGNVDLVPITASMSSPIAAIRRQLATTNEPMRASGNVYWMLDLYREAQERGYRVLLSGQAGNAGSSWQGDFFSQPLSVQLRHLGVRGVLGRGLLRGRQQFLDLTPRRWLAAWLDWRGREGPFWMRSPIHPDLVRRLDLVSLWLEQGKGKLWMPPLQTRYWIV
ncbi:MAG: asparagine synthetase B, partial [Candidatus Wallbacteria bacterium]|nr:asparagine synthetase B [Candidatus Wallbacteria bacterium]